MKQFILALLILLPSLPIFGQTEVPSAKKESIKNYLTNFEIEHNKKAGEKGGIAVKFTGEFEQLPVDLEKSLSLSFPNHHFTIAKMLKFHNAPRPVRLIVVTQNNSNRVASYAWDLSFSGVSDSFRKILSFYSAQSKEDALSKVKSLSELLTFSGNGKVGKIEINKDVITSELFYEYAGEKEPYRILNVELKKGFRFGRIALINPVDDKEGSEI